MSEFNDDIHAQQVAELDNELQTTSSLLSDLLEALDASQREIKTGCRYDDGSEDNITGLMVMTPELYEAWNAAHRHMLKHGRN